MGHPDALQTADLVSQARNGERAAFEHLVQQYEAYVHHLLLKTLHDPDDAADVGQEVWFSVSRSLHRLDDPARFRSWLSRLTVNAAFDFLRKSRRRPRLISFDDEDGSGRYVDPHACDPGEQVLALDVRIRMWAAIAALPEHYRQALVLREYAGHSYDAIAETLGITRSAAETLTSRARRKLAALYGHMEQITPGCTEALQCFVDLTEGTLSRRQCNELRRHAKTCDACATYLRLAETANGRRGIRAWMVPPWLAATGLVDALFSAWRGVWRPAPSTTLPPAGAPVPLMVAVVGVLAAFTLLLLGSPMRPAPVDLDSKPPPTHARSALPQEQPPEVVEDPPARSDDATPVPATEPAAADAQPPVAAAPPALPVGPAPDSGAVAAAVAATKPEPPAASVESLTPLSALPNESDNGVPPTAHSAPSEELPPAQTATSVQALRVRTNGPPAGVGPEANAGPPSHANANVGTGNCSAQAASACNRPDKTEAASPGPGTANAETRSNARRRS